MRVYSPSHQGTRRHHPKSFSLELSGRAQSFFITFFCFVFVGSGVYLYSVNQSAVHGYEMRTLEKEISSLKKKNAELTVLEAEARSLSRIETGSETLRMEKVTKTQTLNADITVAIR